MRRLLQAAAQRGVAMEVNSWPERLDLNDTHILLAREAGRAAGDRYRRARAGTFRNLFFGVATARRGWATPADIFNTLPLKRFLPRLRRYALRKAA